MTPAELAAIRHVVLDLDGTLYRGNRLFDATLPFLAQLKAANIGVTFLTNNTSRSKADYVAKLGAFGIAADAEEIYTPADSTLRDYLHLLSALGVERAVLVQPSVYGTDNRALLDALARIKKGLRGIAVVDFDGATRDIRAMDEAGIRGVRLNVVDHSGERNVVPVEDVRRLAETIAPFGWHIEFLVNLDEAPRFAAATRSAIWSVVGEQ